VPVDAPRGDLGPRLLGCNLIDGVVDARIWTL
jgi:hypothetical protein